MSRNSCLQDGFTLISYKRKHKKVLNQRKILDNSNSFSELFDQDTAIRRINEAKEDILVSDLYTSFLASLRESQAALLNSKVKEIVCLGLGRIGECMIARYQLGLLLCLKDLYKVTISIYDPVFTENENGLLKNLGCEVLVKNIEGKYHVDKTTLFFLPHCPKQLANNLLWANWGLRLCNCIIIANSFTSILETNSKRCIQENAEYVLNISPYTLEIAIINTFRYYDIFNNLAVHVFPYEKLRLLSDDFWKYNDEPKYCSDDIEFITNVKVNDV